MDAELESWIKEAAIHDALGTHTIYKFPEIYNGLAICSGCHHLIRYQSGDVRTIRAKDVSGVSSYNSMASLPNANNTIRIYEHLEYLRSPIFAFHFAQDIIMKATPMSRYIASLDEIYGFHYANEIEHRTSAETVKEFNRIFRKKLEESNTS